MAHRFSTWCLLDKNLAPWTWLGHSQPWSDAHVNLPKAPCLSREARPRGLFTDMVTMATMIGEKLRGSNNQREPNLSRKLRFAVCCAVRNAKVISMFSRREDMRQDVVVPLWTDSSSRRSDSLVPSQVVEMAKRRWRMGSLSDGGIFGATRRLVASREDIESDRRKNNRNKHLKHKRDLLEKFRLVAKLAVFCARQAREHRLKDKLYDEIMPYVNEIRFHDYEQTEEMQGSLSFDPSSFKADKQMRISEDTKKVLTTHPSERTEKQIIYAQLALRNIHSIAEYPVRMQKKIVEVGRYEKYDAKRVVVRQGHPATAFYFILSGSVVVMVSDPETMEAKPVAYLRKGKPFGELAIIKRTTRHASIIAKETLELLSIDIEDFHQIFMAGGVKNIHDPDHNAFVRNLKFLRQWPLEKMVSAPDKCQFFFFKQGELMVRDSQRSNWLFIVKSGSLRVLKKLKRVSAFEWKKKSARHSPRMKTEKEWRNQKDSREKQRRHIIPQLRIPLRDSDCELENVELPELPPMTYFNETDSDRTRRLSRWTTESQAPHHMYSDSFHRRYQKSTGRFRRSQLTIAQEGGDSANLVPPQLWVSKSEGERNWMMSNRVMEFDGHNFSSNSSGNMDPASSRTTKQKERSIQRKKTCRSKREEEQDEMEREMKGRKQVVRTFIQDLDGGYKHKSYELTEADLDPQFVHIQTLTKGQVFGLSELILGNQPSFCVVSNGAECIMVDKQFYTLHASEELLSKVRTECCPYPSDEEMQEGLQASVDWEAYKSATFMDTLTRIRQRKTRLNSPRT